MIHLPRVKNKIKQKGPLWRLKSHAKPHGTSDQYVSRGQGGEGGGKGQAQTTFEDGLEMSEALFSKWRLTKRSMPVSTIITGGGEDVTKVRTQ